MTSEDKSFYDSNEIEEDSLLEKDRINRLDQFELDEEEEYIPPGPGKYRRSRPKQAGIKKPIIIMSSIALVALIVIAIVVLNNKTDLLSRFKEKKATTAEQIEDKMVPFLKETTTINVVTDNIQLQRAIDSYNKGLYNEAISDLREVVNSDATDKDKATALTYLGVISNQRKQYKEAEEYFTRALKYDRLSADTYHQLAVLMRNKNDFESAIKYTNMALELNPRLLKSYLLLGNIYFAKGDYNNALLQYKKALEISPDNPKVNYNIGITLLNKRDEFSGIEYLKKAADGDKIGEVAYRSYSRLGELFIDRAQFSIAEDFLNKAIALRPNDALARYHLGITYLRQKKFDKAIEQLKKSEEYGNKDIELMTDIGDAYSAMNDFEKSIAAYNKVLAVSKRNSKILSRIAEIYYKNGELDKAYNAYKQITIIEPATENARIAYLNMGVILDDAGRYEEAINVFNKAMAINARDSSALYNLGIAYKHANIPEKAIQTWRRASNLDPADPKPVVAIADYYYERNFFDLAEKEYEKIIERWPNSQEGHFRMGSILYKRENYPKALKAFERVFTINNKNDYARKALLNSGIILSKKQDNKATLDKAQQYIDRALMIKPGDPEGFFALGVVYMKKEEYDNAIDRFYQTIEHTKDNKTLADAYNNIGKCYYKQQKFNKALKAFTSAVEEDPANEEIRINKQAASQAYESQLDR